VGFICCFSWGFVTHGGIDGYSRVITFLQTKTNNIAKAVLNLFVQATVCHLVCVLIAVVKISMLLYL
jgi:hypothetical protein